MYDDPSLRGIIDKVLALIEQPGWSNALTQKVLALTGPGVPDVYAGTEVWEDSLVDPDNRRPVDFPALSGLASRTTRCPAVDQTGEAKWWVSRTALRLRRDHPELFTGYTPILAEGPLAEHLVGFDRGGAITVATRLPISLAEAGGWGDTMINFDGTWTDSLTGQSFTDTVAVTDVFRQLPVALLTRTAEQ